MVRFYGILEEGAQFLIDEQQKELATLSRFLLGSYFALSAEALRNGLRMWKVTPKFHAFQHLCEVQSQIMNPRFVWCYADEDLQRHVGDIATACFMMRLAYMVLYRWVILTYDEE